MTALSPLQLRHRAACARLAASLARIDTPAAQREAREALGLAWGHKLGGACPAAWIEREALALADRLAAALADAPARDTWLGRARLAVIEGGRK